MDQKKQEHLSVNNIAYKKPLALSLSTQRQYERHFPQKQTYSSSEIVVFDVNSGDGFVDPRSSYLTFTVALTGTTPTGNFGSWGSATNVIRSVRFLSRSGVEVCRSDAHNLLSTVEAAYYYSDRWIALDGAVQGFTVAHSASDSANLSATAVRFVLPMWRVCHLFRPIKKGEFIPPQLLSGGKLEITLADYRQAIYEKSGTVTGYTLASVSMMCDTIKMTDDTMRVLNNEAAKGGLEYLFQTSHHNSYAQSAAQTSFSAQSSKAVSQGLMAFCISQTDSHVLSVANDSLKAVAWDVEQWQWRLGSHYYPSQAIQDASSDGVESFLLAKKMWDVQDDEKRNSSVSLALFGSHVGIIPVDLQRSQELDLSGSAINNSRLLELNLITASPAAQRLVNVFISYVTACKVYPSNVVVAI